MALGPGTVKVELMPAAAWVDVSAYLDLSSGVKVRPACSPLPWSDVEAGSATFALDDPSGTWWPDNPGSPYYKLVRKGMPCRITGTLGTTSSVRHVGRVRLITPTLAGTVGTGTRIQMTSTDVLADLQGKEAQDRLSEELRAAARYDTYSNGVDAWDSWPLTGSPSDDSIPSTRDGSSNSGRVVWPASGAGAITFNQVDGSTVDGPINLPAMATFEPSGSVGPVLSLPVSATTSGQFYIAFRTSTTAQRTVAAAFDGAGAMVWQLQVQTDGTLTLRNGQGLAPGNWAGKTVVDGAWHTVVFYGTSAAVPGSGQTLTAYLDGGSTLSLTYDLRTVRSVCVGGYMPPSSRGKQSECLAGDVTMLGTLGANQVGALEHACAMFPEDPAAAFARLDLYNGTLTGGTSVGTVTTTCDVVTGPTHDSSLLDLLRGLMRSTGARLWVQPGTLPSQLTMLLPEDPTPAINTAGTTSFTATISNDDADGLEFLWGADQDPTRCVVTGPTAAATFVGDESDVRQDDSIQTWNVSEGDAYALGGGWVQTRPDGLRLGRVPIEAATAVAGQTLADGLLAMVPMRTVFTLAGVPAVPVGVTQTDLIAVGWDETWSMQQTLFEIDSLPAAAWPRGIVASSGSEQCVIGGSTHTVTAGSAALGTGTATTLTVTSPDALFVTGTSRFFNWAGECIQGSFAGGASPQTLTVTARGQKGTIARTHTDGEAIDIWHPFRLGMG